MRTIVDACCAINLHNGRAMDAVLSLPDLEACVGARVIEECAGDCAEAMCAAVRDGRLAELDEDRIGAALYLSLLAQHKLGEGETECLAAATVDSELAIASDDRKARTVATALFGSARVTGSLGLLRRCVKAAVLTTNDAFGSYTLMVNAGAFLPKVDVTFFQAA